MACTWGSKVNGILTVFAIGVAVLIDLWDLLGSQEGKYYGTSHIHIN